MAQDSVNLNLFLLGGKGTNKSWIKILRKFIDYIKLTKNDVIFFYKGAWTLLYYLQFTLI